MIQELFKTTLVMSKLFLEIYNKLAFSHLKLSRLKMDSTILRMKGELIFGIVPWTNCIEVDLTVY